MTRSTGRVLRTVAILTVFGCSSDKSPGPTPSIQVTVAPTSLTLQQGTSGTVGVTLTRSNFTAPVNVSVTGLPGGVTVTVAPPQLTGATASATVTVDVAASVAPGTYQATIRAAAAGVGEATTTYGLTVTAIPNYTLSATAVSVAQGLSGTSTIGIARANFAGAVTLTLDAPPAGITGTFSPNPSSADNSVLTINVAPTVAVTTYNLNVKGTATGQPDKTTVVALTVTQQPDYSLSATPNTLTINAGSSQTTTINIARTNFTGAVTLALDAPPAGITAAFNPAAPTGASSVATISIASTVAPAVYSLTIKGTASGVPTAVDGAVSTDAALALGDRTTTVSVTVLPAPDFTIAATPNAITVAAGGSGNTTVNITRTNLTDDMTLSLVTPPAGVTGVFTPPTLTGATLSSTLAISVAGSVVPAVIPVTVQGTIGAVSKTTVVTVTVVSGPTVSLATNPTSLSIEQGASAQSTLTATRTNYNGSITPSSTGQPNGMLVTFNPNPIPANTSTINVAVGGSVPVGPYTLTITGASGLAGNPTTTLTVNVTAPVGTGINWDVCTADGVPLKFWRQSGGTWAEVTPTVVGNVTRFSFTINGSLGGIAFTEDNNAPIRTAQSRGRAVARSSARRAFDQVRAARSRALEKARAVRGRMGRQSARLSQQSAFSTSEILAATSELQGGGSFGGTCAVTPTTVVKNFTTAGQSATEEGLLGYGGTITGLTSAITTYDVNVEPGTYDWLAAFGPAPAQLTDPHAWAQYKVGRGEPAPGASVLINRVSAVALTSFPFTVTGGNTGSLWSFSELMSGARGGIGVWPLGPGIPSTTNGGNLFFMAPGDRLGTDIVALDVSNFESLSNLDIFRLATYNIGSGPPASGTFVLNQEVPPFVVSPVSGAPVPTWSVSGQTPTDYQGSGSFITANFTGVGGDNDFTVSASDAWLNAMGFTDHYTLAGAILPNFNALWAPAAPLDNSSVFMTSGILTTGPGSNAKLALRTQRP